jgi:hypothetical protein
MALKLKYHIGLLLPLLYFTTTCSAQEWRIQNTLNANDSVSYAALRYSADNYGFAEINYKGQVGWEIPVPGEVIGMSNSNGKILVFYAIEKKYYYTYDIREIHVLSLDPKSHSQLSDQIVFTKKSKYSTIPEVINDVKGNFKYLLLRVTLEKEGRIYRGWSINTDLLKTTEVTITTISSSGVFTTAPLTSKIIDGNYAGSCTDMNGQLYMAGILNGQLTLEQFDSKGKLSNTLSTTLGIRENWWFQSVISSDQMAKGCVDLCLYYKNKEKDFAISLFRFDYLNKKVIEAPASVLKKEYQNQIKEGQTAKIHSSNIRFIEDLKPIAILETENKIIVIKEIQLEYSLDQPGSAERYSNDAGIVSVYSKDLKPLHDVVIDKTIENFLFSENGMGCHLKNDKLYFVVCEDAGVVSYSDFLYTLDIENGNLTKNPLSRDIPNKSWLMESQQAIWFSDHVLTPVVYGAHSASKWKFKTYLQSYPF